MNRDDAPSSDPPRARLRVDVILMLVLLIGPIVAGIAMGGLGAFSRAFLTENGEGTSRVALDQLKELGKALEFYCLETGAYPEELAELTKPTQLFEDGILPEIPLDPWKRGYVYRLERDGYVLLSRGRDGEVDTDDDIRLWD